MERSNHKNFVELYWRNREALISNEILLYQDSIFNLFSTKFKYDADKDWEKNRIKLERLWYNCANKCDEIHKILSINDTMDDDIDLQETVNNIVNMDYGSVEELFNLIKKKYQNKPEIYNAIQEICNNLAEMRRISKKHTNIITK